MLRKYQKPFAVSLGEILPEAQGYCGDGSTANTAMPITGNSCYSGYTASGAGCAFGGVPGTQACFAGKTQLYFGCSEGFRASGGSGMCFPGTGVLS